IRVFPPPPPPPPTSSDGRLPSIGASMGSMRGSMHLDIDGIDGADGVDREERERDWEQQVEEVETAVAGLVGDENFRVLQSPTDGTMSPTYKFEMTVLPVDLQTVIPQSQ
ncbi:hypothetical protein KIPB_012493, partial [Kipferlia bialata]